MNASAKLRMCNNRNIAIPENAVNRLLPFESVRPKLWRAPLIDALPIQTNSQIFQYTIAREFTYLLIYLVAQPSITACWI